MSDILCVALIALGGSIFTSLIALGGVLWTLRVSQSNFETARREEREKAREEREFTAKHKAILSAAEAIMRFLNYYLTLPDRELPKDGTVPEEVAEMGVSLNRLHFYCDLETIQHAVKMGQVLSTAYTKALRAKMPSMFIAEDIRAIDIRTAGFENANKQLQEEMAVLRSSDITNQVIAHRQQLASNFGVIAELNAKKASLSREMYDAKEECRDVMKGDLREVYAALFDVLLMARKELSFPIDESAYAALINESTEKMLASLGQLFDEVRTQVRQKMERASGRTPTGK